MNFPQEEEGEEEADDEADQPDPACTERESSQVKMMRMIIRTETG